MPTRINKAIELLEQDQPIFYTGSHTGAELSYDETRELVYGMTYADWKQRHQTETAPDKVQQYKDGLAKHGEAGENWFDKPV